MNKKSMSMNKYNMNMNIKGMNINKYNMNMNKRLLLQMINHTHLCMKEFSSDERKCLKGVVVPGLGWLTSTCVCEETTREIAQWGRNHDSASSTSLKCELACNSWCLVYLVLISIPSCIFSRSRLGLGSWHEQL